MELWIRTQREDSLVKVDEISVVSALDRFDNEVWLVVAKDTILARYKTKKRALEVLDEIQNKINLINLGHDFGSPMIDLKKPTYIYQMPPEVE